jgi:DnaJ-domain-containing protein 1
VAAADDIPGLGPRSDRPRFNPAADLTRLSLSPTEGFVLSRIDGRASYDEICRISTLGREETLTILRKLKKAAVILGPRDVVVTPTASKPAPSKAATPPREPRTPAPVKVTDEMLRKVQEQAGGKPEEIAEPGSLLVRLDDGSPVDPADLIEGHDISADMKRRILRLHRRLRKLSAHELLGVAVDADQATLKRAFAAASKELHPDRYYGKDLGAYRAKLAKIFSRLTEAMQELEKGRKGK